MAVDSEGVNQSIQIKRDLGRGPTGDGSTACAADWIAPLVLQKKGR